MYLNNVLKVFVSIFLYGIVLSLPSIGEAGSMNLAYAFWSTFSYSFWGFR